MSGLLVVMGSGETAPTMVKPHRAILERVGERRAVLLDTPYGFQSNADDISARAVTYFAASVGRQIDVLSWRRPPTDTLERERALTTLREAGWVFAGPGSPTYALRQWRDTPVPDLIAGKLRDGGVVCFASAAALTLGSHAIPVYEIYKAGTEPHWVPGLDLVSSLLGFSAVIIPHYDNAEGGHHDTRYCYLGEGRLSAMETKLPDETLILGVDEHTAVVFDLAAGTASVLGNGRLTIRRGGESVVHPTGSVVGIATLPVGGSVAGAPAVSVAQVAVPASTVPDSSLLAAAEALGARFDAALAGRDVDGCVAAILDLEQVMVDWSADTNISDEGERARGLLRSMVVRLGELAQAGARDPREVLKPYVSLLLDLRARARAARDFATSDEIRDRLGTAGVEVRDTSSGVEWSL
ncbi:CysS/YqeB C-terminal domain-containing protein [Phytohabitans kaempferiae]|uniref:Type 1 glutamine amidotransferase-like domain-containing protein n=1 Tax=Phytohabitans kaempferiae TaxID=1620943 RepID=A0ABV6LVQ3_9ACTN